MTTITFNPGPDAPKMTCSVCGKAFDLTDMLSIAGHIRSEHPYSPEAAHLADVVEQLVPVSVTIAGLDPVKMEFVEVPVRDDHVGPDGGKKP